MNLDQRVIEFIKEHHVLTLSTSVDNKPYSCNCFYAYNETDNVLIFTSDTSTKHIKDALQNNYVSGSIVLETKTIGKIQGIQFNGYLHQVDDLEKNEYKKNYLSQFPYAILKKIKLWYIKLSFIKMTDNRLGFGKKIIWEK